MQSTLIALFVSIYMTSIVHADLARENHESLMARHRAQTAEWQQKEIGELLSKAAKIGKGQISDYQVEWMTRDEIYARPRLSILLTNQRRCNASHVAVYCW